MTDDMAPNLTIDDIRGQDVEIPTDFDDGRDPKFPNDYDPEESK